MNITYAPAYEHRHVLDAMVTPEDRIKMTGPYDDPDSSPTWHIRDDESARYAILLDGTVVGELEFAWYDFVPYTGFFLGEPFRGQGILQRAWEGKSPEHGDLFFAGTWEDNHASWRLLEKLGFELTSSYIIDDGRTVRKYMFSR